MYEVLGINVEPKSIVGGLYEKALLGFKKRSGVSTGNNRCSPKSKNKSQPIEFYLSSIISCRSNIEQEWSFISLKILSSHILSVNFIELCFRQINFKFKGISKIAVISFGGNLSNYLCQGVTSAGKHDNWSRCHNSEVFFYFRVTV